MADKKISELPEIPSSDVAVGDWIVVTDSSTYTSKKLDFGDYKITQSPTDTTAGRLLKVGDLGVGGIGPDCADCDDPIWGATQRVVTTTDNTPPPPFASNIAGILQSDSWSGTSTGLQILRVFFPNAERGKTFTRAVNGGTWEPWRLLYDTGNAVGTVSQSGGVPTGAVIESGSNANGEYVRFADGTQICTNGNSAITTNPAAFTGTVTSVDGDKLRIGRWF